MGLDRDGSAGHNALVDAASWSCGGSAGATGKAALLCLLAHVAWIMARIPIFNSSDNWGHAETMEDSRTSPETGSSEALS